MESNEIAGYLAGLHKVDVIYNKVAQLSNSVFGGKPLAEREKYLNELEFLLKSVVGTDTIVAIFNHNTYLPELEVGHLEFWGTLPNPTKYTRFTGILGLLHKDYTDFPLASVEWFANVLQKIPEQDRINMKIHHCGMRFTRGDGRPIRLFSQGLPLQSDEHNNFNFTLNYIQNVQHLIKKDYSDYWIRVAYGSESQFVQTFHSGTKESVKHDLLSLREKEVLTLIAEDWDTKAIAQRLYISVHTVGNHRSNMIDRLGARDSTSLVHLAKMAGII